MMFGIGSPLVNYHVVVAFTQREVVYYPSTLASDQAVSSDKGKESDSEIWGHINQRIKSPQYAPLVAIGLSALFFLCLIVLHSVVLATYSASQKLQYFLYGGLILLWSINLFLVLRIGRQEQAAQISTLVYKMDSEAQQKFQTFCEGLGNLAYPTRLWLVTTQVSSEDRENRNGNPISQSKRIRATVGYESPPYLKVNIKNLSISLTHLKLFFLPDRLLIFEHNSYRAVKYDDLHTIFSKCPDGYQLPIEINIKPNAKDSEHWKRTLVECASVPIYRISYGYPVLADSMTFLVSEVESAERVVNALNSYKVQFSDSGTDTPTPYHILGISRDSTEEEINAAYRRVAQMNHPDKVANLAPEFTALAERRMKEINAAYDELKRTVKGR